MPNFDMLREQMVDTQIRTNGITEYNLIAAFLSTPREQFLPASRRSLAYLDTEITLPFAEKSRTIHDPRALAHLMKAANVQPDDSVLDVGGTVGYSAAVLSKLAAAVTLYESSEEALASISEVMIDLEIATIITESGDLSTGFPNAKEEFNAIIIHGALEQEPEVYFKNLAENGRLICILFEDERCVIKKYQKLDGSVTGSTIETIPSFAADFLTKDKTFEFAF